MPQGYEQNRLPAGSTGPISPARARRNSNNLSGTSSVLREIGLNKADPEIALHIVREGLGSGVIVERIQEGEFAASYIGRAARGTEITPSAVSDNDDLLTSGWAYGYAGPNNGYVQAGFMQFEVDDTVSDAATGVPCRIIFKTSDGSAFSERVRIDKSGNVGIGITPTNKLHVVGNIQLNARGEVRFADSDSSHYTGIKSAATVSSSHTYTLPAAFPASNKILQSTDAGILSWESAGSGSGDITGVTIQTDSGSGSKATDEDGSADFILQGDSAGIDVTNSGATITVALDLNEISAGVAADGDSFVFVDANDSNANKKEAIADLATLFAGDGLTASSSVMAVNVDDSTIETNSDAIRIKDDGVTYAKIQNVTTTNRILGRDSSGAGVIEEITPANLRTMINVADGATATTDTNTTYSVSCVDGDNSDEEKIRLTAGGSGSGTDDVVLEAGTGLSIARSSDKITFTNTVSDTDTTYSISCVDGDNSDEEKIRLTAGGSGSGTDDIVLEAGTGLSIARSSDKITFTNTVSDTNTTYAISCVDGDNSDEEKIRLTAGGSGSGTDDIVLEAGTGLSIARSSDKITFTNTVSDTNTTYSAGNGIALSTTTFSVAAGNGLAQESSGLALDDPANLDELTESNDATDDKIFLWDEDASVWKYMTLDNLQDSIDTTGGGGGSGDVVAGSTFTTAGVIMACDGDDKTIDEPGATLTTNGQAMTVSSAVATSFAVDGGNRDGNSSWTFTTGTGDSGSAQNNQASIKVTAQTSANANLYLGDTGALEQGGLRYKNNGDSLQIRANNQAVLECDSSKVVEFKIAGGAKTVTLQNNAMDEYMSGTATVTVNATEWLQIKVNGNTRYIPVWS